MTPEVKYSWDGMAAWGQWGGLCISSGGKYHLREGMKASDGHHMNRAAHDSLGRAW